MKFRIFTPGLHIHVAWQAKAPLIKVFGVYSCVIILLSHCLQSSCCKENAFHQQGQITQRSKDISAEPYSSPVFLFFSCKCIFQHNRSYVVFPLSATFNIMGRLTCKVFNTSGRSKKKLTVVMSNFADRHLINSSFIDSNHSLIVELSRHQFYSRTPQWSLAVNTWARAQWWMDSSSI